MAVKSVPAKTAQVGGGSLLVSWFRNPTTKECKDEIRKVIASMKLLEQKLKKVPNFLNGNGKLPPVPIKFDCSRLEAYLTDPEPDFSDNLKHAVAAARQGKAMGALTDDQIYTMADAICTFFDPEIRHDLKVLILLGLTQLGKTPVFSATFLLLPVVVWLLEGRLCIPTLNTPSDNNIYAQILRELQHSYSLLKRVRVVNTKTKQGISVEQYFDELVRDAVPVNDDHKLHIGIPDQLVKPRNRSWKNTDFERIAGLAATGKKVVVLSFSDECHEGQETKGFIDKQEQAYYENVNYIHVTISASPDEHIAAAQAEQYKCRIVKQYVPCSYVGLSYYAGYRLPTMPGYKERVPKTWDVFRHFPNLQTDLDPTRFVAAMNGAGEDKAYMDKFADDIVSIIKKCDTKVFFIRPFPNNKYACEVLSKMMADRLGDDMDVLPYYGNLDPKKFGGTRGTGDRRTIKEVIMDQYVARNRKVVVVSCYRSRRGDSYPKECKFFMDLTLDSVTWNTFIQSTFGRACGHNKDSVCIFRPEYLASLTKLLDGDDDGYNEDKAYGPRTAHNDGRVRRPGAKGRPSAVFTAILDEREEGHMVMPAALRARLDDPKIIYQYDVFSNLWRGQLAAYFRKQFSEKGLDYEVPDVGDVVNCDDPAQAVKFSCRAVDYRYYTNITTWYTNKSGGAQKDPANVYPLCVYRFVAETCNQCGKKLNQRMGTRASCCLKNAVKIMAIQFHLRVGKARKHAGGKIRLIPKKKSRITKLFPEIESV